MEGVSLLKLASRNLLRHRRRTAITAVGLSAGFGLTVFFGAFYDGMHAQMIDAAVRGESGHVSVRGIAGERIAEAGWIIDEVEVLDPTAVVLPRLAAEGVLKSSGRSIPVAFIGVDASAESGTGLVATSVKEGAWLAAGDRDGIVIGTRAAATLRATPGAPVILLAQGPDRSPMQRRLFVRGIFRTGVPEADARLVQVSLETAREWTGPGEVATEVAICLDDASEAGEFAARAAEALRDRPVDVLTWDRALPRLSEVVAMDEAGLALFLGILYVIVGFGVLNTVLMSVTERTREFGTLLAIGATPGTLVAMVLAEAGVLAAASVVLGAAIVLPADAWFGVHGFDIGFLLPDDYQLGGVALGPDVFFRTRWDRVAWAAALVLLTAMVAGLVPAIQAARQQPSEAMGGA
jgi:ABC-type lipoprotein release transport system permease subunit